MGTPRKLETPMTLGSKVRCIITHRGRIGTLGIWSLWRQQRRGNPWVNSEIPSTIEGIIIDQDQFQLGSTITQYFILVQLPEFQQHPEPRYNQRHHIIAQTEKELDIFWEAIQA
jgi:hypothetical protein